MWKFCLPARKESLTRKIFFLIGRLDFLPRRLDFLIGRHFFLIGKRDFLPRKRDYFRPWLSLAMYSDTFCSYAFLFAPFALRMYS